MLKLFKKKTRNKKDVLIVLLTSADENRLLRLYTTISSQINYPFTFDVMIVVNSLNDQYINLVKDKFKGININIVETRSNGKCGVGKNSVLNYFRNLANNPYDYLLTLDGDDFLYPTAFMQLNKLLSKKPDIIGIQSSDIIRREDNKPAGPFYHVLKDNIFLQSWNDEEINLSKQFPKNINKKVSEQFPPDRTLFLSKNLLLNEKDLFFPEEIKIFEDYVFCVRLYEKMREKDYSYIVTNNSYIYIYDKINDAAITKSYKNPNEIIDKVNEYFIELMKPMKNKKYDINFAELPFFALGKPGSIGPKEKIEYIMQNLIE